MRNPTGRNGKPRLEELREFLNGKAEPTSSHTRRENILLAIYTTAIDRRRRDHVAAAWVLLSYDVGLPPQAIDLSNTDGSLGARVTAYIPDNGRGPRSDKLIEGASPGKLASDDGSTSWANT